MSLLRIPSNASKPAQQSTTPIEIEPRECRNRRTASPSPSWTACHGAFGVLCHFGGYDIGNLPDEQQAIHLIRTFHGNQGPGRKAGQGAVPRG
jgi:hypothetical protein